jgi:DNA-binding response OmpR family regulator
MKKKILVVDDDLILRTLLEENLTGEGYEVDTAASGEVAVAMLASHQYNLVITDLVMDKMSGLEVLRRAKEQDKNIIVFVLTGYGELDSAVEALRAGAEDYLLKPYNAEELFMRIARNLEKQEMRKTIDLYENILSICSECKKIRDDSASEPGQGEWVSMEQYLSKTIGSAMSHGLCPVCYKRHLRELENLKNTGESGEKKI